MSSWQRSLRGQLSLTDALTLVACYALTGSPKFEKAAVRWLVRIAEERKASLRDIRLAANCLEALRPKHHDLAEKMLLRFLASLAGALSLAALRSGHFLRLF